MKLNLPISDIETEVALNKNVNTFDSLKYDANAQQFINELESLNKKFSTQSQMFPTNFDYNINNNIYNNLAVILNKDYIKKNLLINQNLMLLKKNEKKFIDLCCALQQKQQQKQEQNLLQQQLKIQQQQKDQQLQQNYLQCIQQLQNLEYLQKLQNFLSMSKLSDTNKQMQLLNIYDANLSANNKKHNKIINSDNVKNKQLSQIKSQKQMNLSTTLKKKITTSNQNFNSMQSNNKKPVSIKCFDSLYKLLTKKESIESKNETTLTPEIEKGL